MGYRLEDGEKVSQGGAVADIFSSEDAAAAVQQSEQLEAEIQRLESLDDRGNTYAQDIQQIDERLDQALQELMEAVQSRDAGAIAQAREEAAYQISQAPDCHRGERGLHVPIGIPEGPKAGAGPAGLGGFRTDYRPHLRLFFQHHRRLGAGV